MNVYDLFVKAIEAMSAEKGIKTLNFLGRKKFHCTLSIVFHEWTTSMTIIIKNEYGEYKYKEQD